ncbi:AzlD domain-containing protein [Falsirhodobacter algicola]|uniref:AzlD domain-containing protein n=1 Tax=Falsirhodobacter algicola TaxID=2692330 RepID=A0A8J8MSE9_9RHOB|nr:AzlD domain-containing protein [Falsirhodobacter algicola]QUS35885.1 AzlD domain-containing protein [Falsirhodobacter algicola]
MTDPVRLWLVMLVLGAGTFLLRYAFLALRGEFPPLALRLLRYTPVAVLPGLVAPMVLWPAATGGETDPARLAAAIATVAVGLWTRNVLAGILGGAAVLYGLLWLL